jgi:hypothetical protein
MYPFIGARLRAGLLFLAGLPIESFQIVNLVFAPFWVRAQDFDASVHAAVADEDLWTGDKPCDFVCALAAEGTFHLS